MSNFNDPLKDVKRMEQLAAEMLAPYKQAIERVQQNKRVLDTMPTQKALEVMQNNKEAIARAANQMNNPAVVAQIEQIRQIQRTIESIKSNVIPNQVKTIRTYLDSYNETKNLVNNYQLSSVDKDNEQLQTIRLFKEQYGDLPDIEPELSGFNEVQKEEIRNIFEEAFEEAVGEKKEGTFLNKLGGKIGLFVSVPQIPEAVEKYFVFIKTVYSFFNGE